MNLHDLVNLIELLAALYVGWRVVRWYRRRRVTEALKYGLTLGVTPTLLALLAVYLISQLKKRGNDDNPQTPKNDT